MKMNKTCMVTGAAVLLLGACTTLPSGPSVMALPGSGKNFDQFRVDDFDCRQYATMQVGGSDANQAGSNAGLKSAAVGTAIGAVAGAAMGGHDGAGSGAAAGLIVGSMAGAGTAEQTAWGTQRRYDNAYVQCMYAKGHRVPVSGGYSQASPAVPQGSPPPPPPDARLR